MWLIGFLTTAVACVATWMITPAVVALAHRFGAVDLPGPRKIHAAPIPRIGGLAVFFGFLAGLIFASFATGYVANVEHNRPGYWAVLAVAAFSMLILGLVDDLRGVSFQRKFAFQVAAAALVWWVGFRIEVLGLPLVDGVWSLGLWSMPLTILWIVGITNAFNLIDGLDGLAAGTALITTTVVAVIAMYGGHVAVTAVSVALVGSLVGFLRYNFNPAVIFLGDSGSMFLGFSLAVMSIHGSQKNVTAVAVLAPLLILGYPILDTGLAILRRVNDLQLDARRRGDLAYMARNAHRIFLPDRGHIHHRLLELGMSHRAAVLALYACALMLAVGALGLVIVNSLEVALLLASVLTLITIAFFVFVIARARLARRIANSASAGPPPPASPTPPIASGGALGRH